MVGLDLVLFALGLACIDITDLLSELELFALELLAVEYALGCIDITNHLIG
ncbi:hypothetical protein NW801_22055 [Brevibacillus laterosporus]|uniref:Uncharacterized protein n=1 Tax=Brevibacillus halotolerans TaxID=1507437 RepID=A0ABT4I2Y4_9BACL|nr:MULTISPECIES: hypothetical protein [Brevibacillus]MCR8987677.1 hypothetical protein [Brevibacillus laterosporus]MCZ0833416.1 hypothetical protein [Brevibacillus halotolerans]